MSWKTAFTCCAPAATCPHVSGGTQALPPSENLRSNAIFAPHNKLQLHLYLSTSTASRPSIFSTYHGIAGSALPPCRPPSLHPQRRGRAHLTLSKRKAPRQRHPHLRFASRCGMYIHYHQLQLLRIFSMPHRVASSFFPSYAYY